MNLSEEDLVKLRAAKIHFCLPCYGGNVSEGTLISICKFMSTAQSLGMSFNLDTMVNESLIPRGRNSLVAKMLYFLPKSTHLMFVDADIGFEVEDIFKLILADKDIVGGLYPKKGLPISYVVNKTPDGLKEGNLVEVRNIGTGFMLIKREVLETMIAAHPELHYIDAIGLDQKYDPFKYALFDTKIDEITREYLSEDYLFCQRWQEMGGKIWADLSITLSHIGHFTFKGDATLLKPHL